MISDRHAPLLALVVALCLVPVVLHSYLGATREDERSTGSIPGRLAEYGSVKTDRDANWGQRRFESFDWIERRYVGPSDEVILTVLRSYDLKKLYHHPELDVAYGVPLLEHHVARLPGRDDVPMHVLSNPTESGAAALYVLQYGDGFIENPLTFQIQSSLELLVSPRRAMTLFFALDKGLPGDLRGTPERLPAAVLLRQAIEGFNAQGAAVR